MKKLLYSLFIVFAFAIVFSACTEEEVKPSTELNGGAGGGGAADPD